MILQLNTDLGNNMETQMPCQDVLIPEIVSVSAQNHLSVALVNFVLKEGRICKVYYLSRARRKPIQCHVTVKPIQCHVTVKPIQCHVTVKPIQCHVTVKPIQCHVTVIPGIKRYMIKK